MQPYIGIDFGTTYSSMAWVNPDTGRAQIIKNAEGEDKTPSVVYFGEGDPIVGTPAEQMLEDETERWRVIASVKRSLVSAPTYTLPGGTRVKPVEIVAAILRKLKQDAETLNFHAPVTHAVISAPASFGTLEHRRLVEAGQMAGFEEIKIAPEPVMAALAYSREGLNVGKHVLVYDLGGGTFDLALLSYDATERTYRLALEPQGRADVGGDDFDRALYDYLDYLAQEQFGRAISPRPYELDQHFLLTCRKRKENLSTSTQATFSSYLLSAENGSNSPVLFRSNVTRGTLEELIDHRVSLTVELTKALLVSAQEQDIYVDTLVLIGGSSRVPMVQRKLTDALAPLKPLRWANQDVAVALGAAYQAQEMWGKAVKPTVSVVSSQSSLTENEQQYRRTVETAWLRRRLDRLERDHLTQVTYKLALDANTTSRIEHEVMGMNRYEAYEASQMQHKDEQPDRIRADVKQDAPSSSTLPSAAGPSPFARSLQVWAIWE